MLETESLKTKRTPTIKDALIVLAITMLLMLTIGAYFAYKFGFWGNIILQFFALAVPLAYIIVRKLDIKDFFPIYKPRARHIIGATFLWLGTLLLTIMSAIPLQRIFPGSVENLNELNKIFANQSFMDLVIAAAVAPAICEEFLFRGFVFSIFKKKYAPAIAIILTSILFGIFHLNFIKLVSTAILGISINYAFYVTDNMIIPAYIHFINNFFSMWLLKIYTSSEKFTTDEFQARLSEAQLYISPETIISIAIFYTILGFILIGMGVYFLKQKGAEI